MRIAALVALLAVTATPAVAQTCTGGAQPYGWIGVGWRCSHCTISSDTLRPTRFAVEPSIASIHDDSPFATLLRIGDVIATVNDEPITTARAGVILSGAVPGQRLTFGVRRDSHMIVVQSRPLPARCRGSEPVSAGGTGGIGGTGLSGGAVGAGGAGGRAQSTASGIGFSLVCTGCTGAQAGPLGSVRFTAPPRVGTVVAGSAAERAGIRAGDLLLSVDAVAITDAVAAERLARAQSGHRLELTLARGSERFTVVLDPAATTPAGGAGTATTTQPRDNTLRYAGRLGTVDVDVRGSSTVVVTETEDEVIIITTDAVIRLRKRL